MAVGALLPILTLMGLGGLAAKQGYDERKGEQAEFEMKREKERRAAAEHNQKYYTDLLKGDFDPESAQLIGQAAVKGGMDPNLVAPMLGQSVERWQASQQQRQMQQLVMSMLLGQMGQQMPGGVPGAVSGTAPSPGTTPRAINQTPDRGVATPALEPPPTVPIDMEAFYRRMRGIDEQIPQLRDVYRTGQVEDFQYPGGTPSIIDPMLHEQSMMLKELEGQRGTQYAEPQPAPQQAPAQSVQPSAKPTEETPAPTGELTIPQPRAGMKPSFTIGSEGKVSATLTPSGPLSGKEVTASLLSQARQQNMPSYKVRAAIDAENARRQARGEPPLDPDDAAINAYEDQRFEEVRKRIEDDLRQRMTPPEAFVAATQMAYDQTGHLPQRWQSVIQPKEGDLASAAYTKAVAQASETLPKIIATASEAKTPAAMRGAIPPGFMSRAIDATPYLRPEDSIRAKHVAAQSLTQRLMPILAEQFPGRTQAQYAALAMQLGAYAVDGEVPRDWHDAVMGQPQAFGFSQDQAAMMQALNISPFDPDAGQRAQDAITQQAFQRQFQERALGTAQDLQAVEETAQRMQPGVSTPPKAPIKTPIEIQRGQEQRALEQKGRIETQQKEIEHEFSKAPAGEIQKVQPVDDLYTTGLAILKHATTKGKDGQSLIDKYGNYPAFVFSSKQAFEKQFGAVPDDVAKYIALLGKIFNVEKKTFAGTATSLNERSDLITFMPDPKENIRTALQKIQTLVSTAGTELERDLGFIEKNYPKTDLSTFGYRRIQKARKEQKESKEKEGKP